MVDPPVGASAAQQASFVADKVSFDVPQVGLFEADRLSGLMYQQMLQRLYARVRGVLGPDCDVVKVPDEVDLPCRVLATLETINVQPLDLVQPTAWSGWSTSPDDVLLVVYIAYMKAKAIVQRDDQKAKDALKNSSGGTDI